MLKRKLNTSLVIALLAISNFSCSLITNCTEGEGIAIEKEISIEHFDKIDLNGPYNVYLAQGEEQNVVVKTQPNLIDLINTDISRGKWKIDFKPCVQSDEEISIYITLPELTHLLINGSGSIYTTQQFKANKLALEINGSGDMELAIEVKELQTKIKGSGNLLISGITKKHKIDVDGSGDIDAFELESAESDININGSGDVKVDVSYSLNAKVNGSGDVYYKGSVKEIQSKINGSGQLKQAN